MSSPTIVNNPYAADCKYGIDCYLQKCWFKHPEGRVVNKAPGECKFGAKCRRANCTFSHIEGKLAELENRLASVSLDESSEPMAYEDGDS